MMLSCRACSVPTSLAAHLRHPVVTDVVGNYGWIKAFFDMRHGQNSADTTVWGPEICSNGQSGERGQRGKLARYS